MKLDDIPENSIIVKMDIKEGANLQLSIAHNVETDDFTEEELEFIYDLSTGLSVHLQRMLEPIVAMGRMSNIISELSEDDGPDVTFEPDEKHLDAIDNNKNSNVISIVKKKLH
jgi:hypothetical protein